MIYKTSSQPGFSPSQRWRSTTCHDPFPYCRVLRSAISSMKDQWNSLPSESLRSKYLNLLCIETNEIEDTFSLDFWVIILSPLLYRVQNLMTFKATTVLLEVGFFQQVVPITDQQITGGCVRNAKDALSVLRDTRKVRDQYIILRLLKLCNRHSTWSSNFSRLRPSNWLSPTSVVYIAP